MPPKTSSKPGGGAPSKKTEQKKKERVIEDKTFGLKNKKGGKQQKLIQQIQKQVISGGNKSAKQLDKEREQLKLKKENDKKRQLEIDTLFKPVLVQTVQKGVDPKSVLCAYFKQGICSKGLKCKFSHDLNIERKSEKRSAYVDAREEDKETNENWDETTLKDVVEKKHGKEATRSNMTQIICKHFLEAVENSMYGWFWNCPGGDKCIYRHALPPGFILNKDRQKMNKQKEEISLEDLIEKERAALGADTTKITLETFLAWKKKKLKDKERQIMEESEKKKIEYKSGREFGISGREMFTFNPDLAVGENDIEDGDGAFDLHSMEEDPDQDDSEDKMQFKEIDYNALVSDYKDVNADEGHLSVANPERLKRIHDELEQRKESDANGIDEGAVAIDEDLFGGDDLDDIDEQLEEFSVS